MPASKVKVGIEIEIIPTGNLVVKEVTEWAKVCHNHTVAYFDREIIGWEWQLSRPRNLKYSRHQPLRCEVFGGDGTRIHEKNYLEGYGGQRHMWLVDVSQRAERACYLNGPELTLVPMIE